MKILLFVLGAYVWNHYNFNMYYYFGSGTLVVIFDIILRVIAYYSTPKIIRDIEDKLGRFK